MGQIRDYDFDAVIGIGATTVSKKIGIGGKINWVGVGARKLKDADGTLVLFDHFTLLEKAGPDFRLLAPTLAKRFYDKNARFCIKLNDMEQAEAENILDMAQKNKLSA